MSLIADQPTNKNFLSPLSFRLALNRTPTIEYFCQRATLPTISLDSLDIPNPLAFVPVPGTKVIFSETTLSFKVDEDLKNYNEIVNWIFALGSPTSSEQYRAINPTGRVHALSSSVYSDGRILVFTSHNNLAFTVHFKDMFPINLSPLNFDTTNPDVQHLEADVAFRYTNFSIEIA
jgi:hypothetical protein